jgi:hypothetical protein
VASALVARPLVAFEMSTLIFHHIGKVEPARENTARARGKSRGISRQQEAEWASEILCAFQRNRWRLGIDSLGGARVGICVIGVIV